MKGQRDTRRLASTTARLRGATPARGSTPHRLRGRIPGSVFTLLLTAALILSLLLGLASGRAPAADEGCDVAPHPSWKGSAQFPDDPFAVDPAPNPRWIKFTILLCDPTRVYFQDGRVYPFHYEFAAARLDPFLGVSRQAFDAATLRLDGQIAVLGAVIFPPSSRPGIPELGIQIVGLDPYPPARIVELFHLVASRVAGDGGDGGDGVDAWYFPAFEQEETARTHAAFLAERGVRVGSADRWSEGNSIYSSGWALGTLKFFAAREIRAAFSAGELRPGDILLTDGVPADVPMVQGILSLVPATPSSHVAILARDYRVPFAYLSVGEDAARALELVGRRVIVSASETFFGSRLRLFDIEGRLDETTVAEILALKDLPPLDLSPIGGADAYSVPVGGLRPADVAIAGGKAANYGFLLRAIPENARVAAAFTFDLWTDFLSQTLGSGKTLREEIAERLAPHGAYPPEDIRAVTDALGGVRRLFTDPDETAFAPALRDAVIAALQDPRYGFDPAKKIRVRSSTNFEDGEQVTGAGLYSSLSGCLLDDLDDDEAGPSLCDPSDSTERGIFRAIRGVFAIFYDDDAWLERRRWDVDEEDVGMALLVHHSFPDETERANGVAALKPDGPNFRVEMVTQVGARSVTNPSDGSIPETVEVTVFDSGSVFVDLVRGSSLVPLGGSVLAWTSEYERFAKLFVAVARAFEAETGKKRYALDFEYKKTAPGDALVVTQVRQLPQPDPDARVTPFLLDVPAAFTVFQGEAGDVFSNHRLKSAWRIETESVWLTEESLDRGVFTHLTLAHSDGCEDLRFDGPVSALPEGAEERGAGGVAKLRWRFAAIPNPRACELEIGPVPLQVPASESPFLTLEDLSPRLRVGYERPVLGWDDASQKPGLTSEGYVSLWRAPGPRVGDLEQTRQVSANGVTVTTRFFWPPPPSGIVAGYTAPLVRWVDTAIEGLTSAPIVLAGERSQTYRPEHHNFSEHFIFAPHEEDGISPDILAELDARDIRWIHVFAGDLGERIDLLGACELRLECACGGGRPAFRRGDGNDDSAVDIADAIFTLNWLFLGGRAPGCEAAADLDGDGSVNITDPVYLLGFLFLGGPAPPAPFPDCGRAAAGASPGCETPPASCAAGG